MEKLDFDAVQTYDSRYTNNQIQIMKVMLPFLEPDLRRTMTIMIRIMELQYTLSIVQEHPEFFLEKSVPFSLDDIFDQLKKYCPPQIASMLENLRSMQNAMKMYEEMKEMMELFGGSEAAEGTAAHSNPEEGSSNNFNPMDMLAGFMNQNGTANASGFPNPENFLNPEQLEMFRMFQSGFSPDSESDTA